MSLDGRAIFALNLIILNLNLFQPDLFRGSLIDVGAVAHREIVTNGAKSCF